MVVVAAALIEDEGRVLLHRRRFEGVHGGLWEFPGGKVQGGESPETALVREIEEELGVRIEGSHLQPLSFSSGPRDPSLPNQRLVILLYTCRHWRGEVQCLAGHELAWFAPGDLAGLDMPPLDYPLAADLLTAFENNSL